MKGVSEGGATRSSLVLKAGDEEDRGSDEDDGVPEIRSGSGSTAVFLDVPDAQACSPSAENSVLAR